MLAPLGFYFDERDIERDIVSAFGGVEVVTDKMSTPYLNVVDTIEKQAFTMADPERVGFLRLRGDSFH